MLKVMDDGQFADCRIVIRFQEKCLLETYLGFCRSPQCFEHLPLADVGLDMPGIPLEKSRIPGQGLVITLHHLAGIGQVEMPFGNSGIQTKSGFKCLDGGFRVTRRLVGIAEIDINPLLVNPEGNVSAVDALVVIGKEKIKDQYLPPINPDSIGALFYPKSVAFVGASAQMGKWGHMLSTNTISGGFEGEIYLVNPKGGTIANHQVYRSVVDIPEKVDIAVVTIPASMVMDLIPPFKEKGISKMLLITSGFGETGKDGKKLEKELVIKAAEAGIHIIGPNTMGICNPYIKC